MKWKWAETKWSEMNELKRRNCNEWLEMNELKWMNWNEWVEINELKWTNWKWKWRNWNEGIAMNDLKWMSWNEWIEMSELKSMNWNEWIENGNEGTETNEFKWMTCQKWSAAVCFCFLCEIKLSLRSRAPFADLMIQKWSEPDSFCDFYVNSNSRYSIVHFLSTSSSKSAPSPTQSRAPFADLIVRKCSEPDSFLQYLCEIELSLQSCALFVGNFPQSTRPNAETETLLRRPRKPLYPKKHRISCPRVFSSLNSRVPDLLHFPTTWWWWWYGCHDDAVHMMIEMMMWLPWRWES